LKSRMELEVLVVPWNVLNVEVITFTGQKVTGDSNVAGVKAVQLLQRHP